MITVRDTGTGIDSEIRPRLFERFASKSFQGTGLGLFISKNIIEAHGDKIWAENNTDGKGSAFHLAYHLASEWRHTLLLTYSGRRLTSFLTVIHSLMRI